MKAQNEWNSLFQLWRWLLRLGFCTRQSARFWKASIVTSALQLLPALIIWCIDLILLINNKWIFVVKIIC